MRTLNDDCLGTKFADHWNLGSLALVVLLDEIVKRAPFIFGEEALFNFWVRRIPHGLALVAVEVVVRVARFELVR